MGTLLRVLHELYFVGILRRGNQLINDSNHQHAAKKRRNCRPTAGAGPHFGNQRILCFEKYLDHGYIDHNTRGKAQGNRQKFSVGVPAEKRDAAAYPGAESSQQCQKKSKQNSIVQSKPPCLFFS